MTSNNFDNKIVITILLPLVALIAPFLVFLIEFYLPYPHFVEEIIKAIFIYFIISPSTAPIIKARLVLEICALYIILSPGTESKVLSLPDLSSC